MLANYLLMVVIGVTVNVLQAAETKSEADRKTKIAHTIITVFFKADGLGISDDIHLMRAFTADTPIAQVLPEILGSKYLKESHVPIKPDYLRVVGGLTAESRRSIAAGKHHPSLILTKLHHRQLLLQLPLYSSNDSFAPSAYITLTPEGRKAVAQGYATNISVMLFLNGLEDPHEHIGNFGATEATDKLVSTINNAKCMQQLRAKIKQGDLMAYGNIATQHDHIAVMNSPKMASLVPLKQLVGELPLCLPSKNKHKEVWLTLAPAAHERVLQPRELTSGTQQPACVFKSPGISRSSSSSSSSSSAMATTPPAQLLASAPTTSSGPRPEGPIKK